MGIVPQKMTSTGTLQSLCLFWDRIFGWIATCPILGQKTTGFLEATHKNVWIGCPRLKSSVPVLDIL